MLQLDGIVIKITYFNLASGLYADTITIIVRQKAHDKKDRSISKGNKDDIVKDLELKKLNV